MIGNPNSSSPADIVPGLSIIHGNHMEDLRQVAIGWIAAHPLAPLENECFVVQSNGMAQWLKLAMADDDGCGISAAATFRLPARFLWDAYRVVLGADQIPQQSPFEKDRLAWRLMRLLPTWMHSDWFAPLARYLADDRDQRKLHQLAVHLADLYDQYQVYRADWLSDWIAGQDRLGDARGRSPQIPPEQHWQAEMWRRIHADVPRDQQAASRFALHRRFLDAMQTSQDGPANLPRRVIVFGISSLPQQALEAIHAISRRAQVLLFVHNPCRHFWADIMEDRELLRIEKARHRRKTDLPETLDLERLHQHVNPLLAAWGKQGRDYIGLLYGYDRPDRYRKQFAEIDLFDDFLRPESTGRLLHQVQQAILDLAPLPDTDESKPIVPRDDDSISFHLAHSRQREVEILHDQLLDMFEASDDLRPQDVIVMTPDIEPYTPHIEAVFGTLDATDRRHIPFTIADRPERASIAMGKAFEKLLHLPNLRLTAGDLMDLLAVPAFRRRFGWAASDLPTLRRWITGSGIRWGIDAEKRKTFDMPGGITQNTWRFGLERMLLGYAVGRGEDWRGIEPYDEIGGLDARLVGPLADMIRRLDRHWRNLSETVTPEVWGQRIQELIHDFFLPVESADQMTVNRIQDAIDDWRAACVDAQFFEPVPVTVVRETLLGAIRQTSVSQRFLAGRINFCTLMPMRAIPFSVVCLLGMNDGEFPRNIPPLDFDLMAGPGGYRPGDRSRREDDRYLFLEALLSARRRLYISYVGRSVKDNSPCMPSVLVGQLQDYLTAGWRATAPSGGQGTNGDLLVEQLTCAHPLQPFSPAYFQPDGPRRRFTYAHEWQKVYDAPSTIPEEMPLAPAAVIDGIQLDQLIRFLKNPVKAFFNQRLKVFLDPVEAAADAAEPFALDHLAPFGLGMELLAAGLAADAKHREDAVHRAAVRLGRSGVLPVGGFGELWTRRLAEPVLRMLAHHDRLRSTWQGNPATVEIRLSFPLPGWAPLSMEAWLAGLRPMSSQPSEAPESPPLARWSFYPRAIMDPKQRVRQFPPLVGLWIEHLAACAQGLALTSLLIAPDGVASLEALAPETAMAHLTELVSYWHKGLCRPLSVTARSALVYVANLPGGDDGAPQEKAYRLARTAYQGDGFRGSGELGYADGAYLRRCYPDFESLWQANENEFDPLARRLYGPIVAAARG